MLENSTLKMDTQTSDHRNTPRPRIDILLLLRHDSIQGAKSHNAKQPLFKLPIELHHQILSYISRTDILAMRRVCKETMGIIESRSSQLFLLRNIEARELPRIQGEVSRYLGSGPGDDIFDHFLRFLDYTGLQVYTCPTNGGAFLARSGYPSYCYSDNEMQSFANAVLLPRLSSKQRELLSQENQQGPLTAWYMQLSRHLGIVMDALLEYYRLRYLPWATPDHRMGMGIMYLPGGSCWLLPALKTYVAWYPDLKEYCGITPTLVEEWYNRITRGHARRLINFNWFPRTENPCSTSMGFRGEFYTLVDFYLGTGWVWSHVLSSKLPQLPDLKMWSGFFTYAVRRPRTLKRLARIVTEERPMSPLSRW